MTYVNMDLQSLPQNIDLRVGTDHAERTLQLSYWQCWGGIQGLQIVKNLGLVPEIVVNAGEEAAYATALDNLITALVGATVYWDEIFALLPTP
jgi:hypothetical protein